MQGLALALALADAALFWALHLAADPAHPDERSLSASFRASLLDVSVLAALRLLLLPPALALARLDLGVPVLRGWLWLNGAVVAAKLLVYVLDDEFGAAVPLALGLSFAAITAQLLVIRAPWVHEEALLAAARSGASFRLRWAQNWRRALGQQAQADEPLTALLRLYLGESVPAAELQRTFDAHGAAALRLVPQFCALWRHAPLARAPSLVFHGQASAATRRALRAFMRRARSRRLRHALAWHEAAFGSATFAAVEEDDGSEDLPLLADPDDPNPDPEDPDPEQDVTLQFVDALTALARELRGVPRAARDLHLRDALRRLREPVELSGAAYVPVGDRRHRIVRVHASESFAFSTKERVPYLVCLEVVSDAAPDVVGHRRRASVGGPPATPAQPKLGQWLPRSMSTAAGLAPLARFDSSAAAPAQPTQPTDEKAFHVVFPERWADVEARVRRQSPHQRLPGWRLLPVIVKADDDLRQEQLASQLLQQAARIFADEGLPLWLRPYDIVATAPDAGVVEAVPDTISLHSLRKNDAAHYSTLREFLARFHGPEGSAANRRARRNFADSLAAYSVVCYVLQVKDRHNGNLLLDAQGHIVHIDFGFLLRNHPGHVQFESAPFKLTAEFVDVLGGPRARLFARFQGLCVRAFLALRRRASSLLLLVELFARAQPALPCFAGSPEAALAQLRERLMLDQPTTACVRHVERLIEDALQSWTTPMYDRFQYCCVGVF